MKGVRKQHLELEVAEINAILGSAKQLVLGGYLGRVRIELHIDGRMESYLSPSLPKAQMYDWLCAFRAGLCITPEPHKPRQLERGDQDPELFLDEINKALETLGGKGLTALSRTSSTIVEQILGLTPPELDAPDQVTINKEA